MMEAAQAKSAKATAGAAHAGIFALAAELRNAAHDDGVHAQKLAQFGCRIWIGAIAVRKILFGHDLIQRLALNHGIAAVLDQVLHQQIGDSFAHVHIAAEQRVYVLVHGAVVEIQNCHTLLAGWRRGAGGRRLRQRFQRQSETQQ